MSANFVREYVINGDVDPFDPIIEKAGIEKGGQNAAQFFDPVLAGAEAQRGRRRQGLRHPYQNSTPLMYYSVGAFKDAGLDPTSRRRHGRINGRCGEKADETRRRRWGVNCPTPTIIAAGSSAR